MYGPCFGVFLLYSLQSRGYIDCFQISLICGILLLQNNIISEYLIMWKWNLNAFSLFSWSCYTFQLVLLFLQCLLFQRLTSHLFAVCVCQSVILGDFDQKAFYLCLAVLLWSIWEKWRHTHYLRVKMNVFGYLLICCVWFLATILGKGFPSLNVWSVSGVLLAGEPSFKDRNILNHIWTVVRLVPQDCDIHLEFAWFQLKIWFMCFPGLQKSYYHQTSGLFSE